MRRGRKTTAVLFSLFICAISFSVPKSPSVGRDLYGNWSVSYARLHMSASLRRYEYLYECPRELTDKFLPSCMGRTLKTLETWKNFVYSAAPAFHHHTTARDSPGGTTHNDASIIRGSLLLLVCRRFGGPLG